jgi:hypothetical protein
MRWSIRCMYHLPESIHSDSCLVSRIPSHLYARYPLLLRVHLPPTAGIFAYSVGPCQTGCDSTSVVGACIVLLVRPGTFHSMEQIKAS